MPRSPAQPALVCVPLRRLPPAPSLSSQRAFVTPFPAPALTRAAHGAQMIFSGFLEIGQREDDGNVRPAGRHRQVLQGSQSRPKPCRADTVTKSTPHETNTAWGAFLI